MKLLTSLVSVSGLSGYEADVNQLIEGEWKSLVDEISFSKVGSVQALKYGKGKSPRSSVMVAAHLDAIGLMVSQVTDGFLRMTTIGGIDPKILPGTPVLVHGRKLLPGVIVQVPAHLMTNDQITKSLNFESLLVDTGLLAGEVNRLVEVGDLISFNTKPTDLGGGYFSGHSLDNRVSVAALTEFLRELQQNSHAWDVWALASVQEELNFLGAATSTFSLEPDLAIILDVTFGKGPGSEGWQTFEMGKAPTIGLGSDIHPVLHDKFVQLAEKLNFPCEIEPMPASSGTEAMAVQVSRSGIPTMVIGIPIRYMHTPVEMVSMKDIHMAARLVTEFVRSLDEEVMAQLVWPD